MPRPVVIFQKISPSDSLWNFFDVQSAGLGLSAAAAAPSSLSLTPWQETRFVCATFWPWLDDPRAVRGQRVLVVEDGPTITHGGMAYGASYLAATRGGAAAVVDPREAAGPALRGLYAKHPHIGRVLPAVGYDT